MGQRRRMGEIKQITVNQKGKCLKNQRTLAEL